MVDYVEIFLTTDQGTLSALGTMDEFPSACLDTGAQKTVNGKQQAHAYVTAHGQADSIGPPRSNVFLFGGGRHPVVGLVEIRVPVSQGLLTSSI